MSAELAGDLESRIAEWRRYASAHQSRQGVDSSATEVRLRATVAGLSNAGLDDDEAFLIALKRVSEDDAMTRGFAKEYAHALWTSSERSLESFGVGQEARVEFLVMLGFVAAAAIAVKIPALFGYDLSGDAAFYAVNLSFFVLPFLAGYFAWKRRLAAPAVGIVAALFVAGAVFANVYPFAPDGATAVLTAIHLPIALWLAAVGVAHSGGEWRTDARRMDFVRFTGEWFVNYTLIALGGGVLTAITIGVFQSIGLDAEPVMQDWVLPCGAMGAVLVAAWLVDARRSFVGGMAPMLARVFTPLFAVMLAVLLAGVIWAKGFIDVEREVLILFDVLLVVVLALLLYALSARDPLTKPDVFDRIQLVLVACALAVDLFALGSIVTRTSEFGFSANKTAALGLNVILLVNLAWSAVLQTGFLRSRRGFWEVESWQMHYLPVYAVWAAIVVVVFPPLFGFA